MYPVVQKSYSRRLIMIFDMKKMALAVGATLVLAACGGGSKEAPKAAAAPASDQPERRP